MMRTCYPKICRHGMMLIISCTPFETRKFMKYFQCFRISRRKTQICLVTGPCHPDLMIVLANQTLTLCKKWRRRAWRSLRTFQRLRLKTRGSELLQKALRKCWLKSIVLMILFRSSALESVPTINSSPYYSACSWSYQLLICHWSTSTINLDIFMAKVSAFFPSFLSGMLAFPKPSA